MKTTNNLASLLGRTIAHGLRHLCPDENIGVDGMVNILELASGISSFDDDDHHALAIGFAAGVRGSSDMRLLKVGALLLARSMGHTLAPEAAIEIIATIEMGCDARQIADAIAEMRRDPAPAAGPLADILAAALACRGARMMALVH